jgi:hypothetical protein
MSETPVNFGAATASHLAASVATLPSAGIGSAFSFERAAGRSIDQVRHACKGTTLPISTATCITYVFCDDLEQVAAQGDFDPINLVWTTDTSLNLGDVEHRIVLISRNGGAGCRSKTILLKMSDHANALAKMGLGGSATVIFQLHSSTATLYPGGITGIVSEHRPFGTVSQLLIGDTLEKTLDVFDDTWLNAPQGHAVVWAKQFKGYSHVPAENTEKLIQNNLQLALMFADSGSLVMNEIPNPDGRADLLLSSETPNGPYRVILELKVLRSHSFPTKRDDDKVSKVPDATNEANALEVVKQAHSYRNRFKAHRACARLYDMRKPPVKATVKTKATAIASTLSVDVWISEVHYTSKEKRDINVENEIAAMGDLGL